MIEKCMVILVTPVEQTLITHNLRHDKINSLQPRHWHWSGDLFQFCLIGTIQY